MKLSRKITIGTLSAVAIAAPAVLAISCGASTPKQDVQVNWDEVEVIFGGVDHQGRAEVKAPEIEGVRFEIDKSNRLSLGEVVHVSAIANAGYSINGNEKETHEFVVNSLAPSTPVRNINIRRDSLNIVYEGYQQHGRAVVKSLFPGLEFTVEGNPMTLSNGDQIRVTARAKTGYTVNYTPDVTYTYTVSGLPDTAPTLDTNINIEPEDIFSGEFTGWNGMGKFNHSEIRNDAYYTIDDPLVQSGKTTGNLSNGDVVTMTARPKSGHTINNSNQPISMEFLVGGLQDFPTQDLSLDQSDFFFEYSWRGNNLDVQVKSTTWFVTINTILPAGGVTEGSTITLELTPDFGFTINGKDTERLDFTVDSLPPRPVASTNDHEISVTRNSFGIAFPVVNGIRTAEVVKKPLGVVNASGGYEEAVHVSLDKTTNLGTGEIVTLTATPAEGYIFTGGSQSVSYQYMVTQQGLYDLIEDNPPVRYEWNADNSHTWWDSLLVRDAQFGIFFPKRFSEMSPWEFGKYLVDMYNNSGSGIMDLTMEYKGHTDTVHVDFKKPLLELVSTFSEAQISPDTPRASGLSSFLGSFSPSTLVGLIQSAPGLLDMMFNYGYDLFFPQVDANHGPVTGGPVEKAEALMDLATRILGGESQVFNQMFPLIIAYPATTLAAFSNLAVIFEEMTKGFATSEVAKEWAKNQTQQEVDELGTYDEFGNLVNCTMANTYIRLVMLQGIGEL